MKLAIFACNNGLGHIRRSIIIAKYLSNSFDVSLFGERKKLDKFKIFKKIRIINLDVKFEPAKNFIQNKYRLKKKLSKYKNKFDLIFADTFPEVNFLGKKIYIFSNFLWHREFKILSKKYLRLEKSLLKKNVIFFSNYLFGKNYLKKFNVVKVPFFENFKKTIKKDAILISFGTAKFYQENKIKNIVEKIVKLNKKNKNKIYLEPRLYKNSFLKLNIHKANYSEKMYNEVSIAITKPGLGTVEECLRRGIKIICFTKGMHAEFKHNANVLLKLKLAYKKNSLIECYKLANNLLYKKKELKKTLTKCMSLKWGGEKTIANYIIKREKY